MNDAYQSILHKHLDGRGPDLPPPEPVKVRSLQDLYRVIKDLQPVNISDKKQTVVLDNIEDAQGRKYKKFPVNYQDDGQPMARKLLVDGFELLKRQQEFDSKTGVFPDQVDEFGGFLPAATPRNEVGLSWIGSFVSKHLDGKIEGLSVVWEIPEGKFRLNPWTGGLTKVVEGAPDTT